MDGSRPASYWNSRVAETDYPRLEGEVAVDDAVIGGGIAGITAATLLKRSGRRVALLEARRVGRQVTGHSNAKITSQHSLIYADLIQRLGEDAAQLYADANQAALELIAGWVAERAIDCAFERRPAYCFPPAPDRVARVEAEFVAATQLGLPASLRVPRLDLRAGRQRHPWACRRAAGAARRWRALGAERARRRR